jgi:hypothetical protein
MHPQNIIRLTLFVVEAQQKEQGMQMGSYHTKDGCCSPPGPKELTYSSIIEPNFATSDPALERNPEPNA